MIASPMRPGHHEQVRAQHVPRGLRFVERCAEQPDGFAELVAGGGLDGRAVGTVADDLENGVRAALPKREEAPHQRCEVLVGVEPSDRQQLRPADLCGRGGPVAMVLQRFHVDCVLCHEHRLVGVEAAKEIGAVMSIENKRIGGRIGEDIGPLAQRHIAAVARAVGVVSDGPEQQKRAAARAPRAEFPGRASGQARLPR